ncbi:GmrSD restriction endonuclease domain-containing protein [Aurantiacibacter sediminis]|uniref:DUF262 domain-containing protein n=1 Tax=Aurantiacibacter sediminis TaxID=2793064 RepID=A0ABS0N1M8_9SPHN|nr:DUF262 domain-containing protein [Aurantiacibacter sediminis]MBH5321870.1 DUF262 domain-containing protein [Aurantiacibacter sediminis]
MSASVDGYLSIVRKAHEGRLKLPAFQRDWKWKPSQVILLLDSLRQGFPIGSLLFIQANPKIDLAPRAFRGASNEAESVTTEELVLDGQQRITAGLELFYGDGVNHYFIDLKRLETLAEERMVDLDETISIRKFLSDLDAEDGYCKRQPKSSDPRSKLIKSDLLWTGLLLDDDELERAISQYAKAKPEKTDFIRHLIGRNFRPRSSTNIPITTIDGETSIEAISRIFSTLNSTGKMLTPFELVVSVLFPKGIKLNDDVETFQELEPFYHKIDPTGDILLQTIAIFDGKDTKKSKLPKTITKDNYERFAGKGVERLAASAKFISDRVGLGLDASNELLVYPVIFSPFAFVWDELQNRQMSAGERASAEQKLAKWFVAAVLSRRYQQSTHDKQARDKTEIIRWIENDDLPEWLTETFVTRLRPATPDGAVGKLLRAVTNSRGLRDPLTMAPVGVGAEKKPSAKHHIFPTRWVHHLSGWVEKEDSANRALNIMYIEPSTNGSWMNCDPRDQVNQVIEKRGSVEAAKEVYRAHGITGAAFDILRKPEKSRQDFYDFIAEREAFFAGFFSSNYGINRPADVADEDDMEDDDER